MSDYLPSLIINLGDPLFLGALFGFLLAIPVALFLAYWLCIVRNRTAVIVGAFLGTLVGFVGILGWVNTLVFSTSLPNTSGVSTFFGTLLLCSIAGLVGGMLTNFALVRKAAKG